MSSASMKRFYVKSSGALKRDITVFSDEEFTVQVFKVDGQMFKKTAAIVDASSAVVLKAETVKTIPMNVAYTDIEGTLVASLTADSPLKTKYMAISLVDGRTWSLEHGHTKQAYTITENNEPIVQLDLSGLLVHKKFIVDIAKGVDVPLALGVAWALNLAALQRTAGAGGALAAV